MIFEGKQVEVFEFDGKVLFNPRHVGECLGMTDSTVRNYLAEMNERQAIVLTNSKVLNRDIRKLANRGEKFITESGVYKLIFKSKKKEAERFQDWVTDEVLPQIRQTGGYIPVSEEDSEMEILAKAVLISQKTIEKKDAIIAQQSKKLQEQQPKVDYYDSVLNTSNLISITEIANYLGFSAKELNNFLAELGVQNKQYGYWKISKKYLFLIEEGFADYHIVHKAGRSIQHLKWTEKGRKWIIDLLKKKNLL